MGFAANRLIVGHRGAAGLAPENTLQSFAAAMSAGVHAVELDVHWVHGRLLVIHDETLDRTTSGRGPLAHLGLSALRALDAGDGQRIPFLEEVFEALPPEVGINVELKGAGTAEPTLAFLQEAAAGRDLLISSRNAEELARAAQLAAGRFKIAPIFYRWQGEPWDLAARLGAWSIHLKAACVTWPRLQEAGRRGFKTLIYTVNEAPMAERLFQWGATGIFTDFPDRMGREWRNGRGYG